MKNMNLKLAVALSALALSSCNGGGSGGGSATQTNVTVPGIKQQSYPGYNGYVCNVGANSYQCTGTGYSGPVITFTSLQDMCYRLQNDPATLAHQERQLIINDQCRGQIGGGLFNPNLGGTCPAGTVLQNSMCVAADGTTSSVALDPNTKIILCRINASAGDWSGDSGEMQIPVARNTPTYLYGGLGKSKSYLNGIFNSFRLSSTKRLATISAKLVNLSGQSDLIQVRITTKASEDGNKVDASATGFAGTTTNLTVSDERSSDGLNISVECRATDSVNLVKVNNARKYKCTGAEINNGKKKDLLAVKNIGTDWEDLTFDVSKNLHVATEGSVLNSDGSLSITQSDYGSTVVVSSKSSLVSPGRLDVARPGDNSKMSLVCRPTP